MDVAVTLAKCREAALELFTESDSGMGPDCFIERITTALLAARADALCELGTPYRATDGPGPAYRAYEELEREVRNRRANGL
jgi:hypothetical protein